MSKWTPEPWDVDGKTIYAFRKTPRPMIGSRFYALFQDAVTSDAELEANAARAVACVNALSGLNPEALAGLLEQCDAMVSASSGEIDCDRDDECGVWPGFIDALAKLRQEAP